MNALLPLLILLLATWWRLPAGPLVQHDLLALLPQVHPAEIQRASRQLAAPYENQTLWALGAPSAAEAVAGVRALQQRMQASGLFALTDLSAFGAQQQALINQLRPYQWQLLSAADAQALSLDPEAWLQQQLARQYSLIGAVSGRTLRQDPLGTFSRFLQQWQQLPSGATLVDGVPIIARDGQFFGLLSAQPLAAAYDLQADADAGNLLAFYHQQQHWAQQKTPPLQLHATGAPLYAAWGAASAKREIQTIGGLSLLTIVLLLWWRFRSARALLLTLCTVAAGVLGGGLSTLLWFGQIHLLTLVFGVTVVGAAVDYAFHYLADSLRPNWNALTGLAHIMPGLRLALLTSLLAFLTLTLAPFPALRQGAFFVATGLLWAWLTVVLLLPLFMRPAHKAPALRRWQPRLPLPRGWLWVLVALVATPGLLRLQSSDDVRLLYAAPAQLQADERVLASLAPRPQSNRFLLLQAPTPAALLAQEERLRTRLDAEVGAQAYQASSQWLPSPSRQQLNRELLAALATRELLQDYLQTLGFDPELAQSHLDALAAPVTTLTPADVLQYLPPAQAALWLDCAAACYSAISLAPEVDARQLQPLLGASIMLVDLVGDINAALAHYRQLGFGLLVLALVGAALLLSLLLGWRRALPVLAVPVLAMLVSLAMLGYLGVLLSLFNLLALLLILGVGIDYALFYHCAGPGGRPSAVLAISMAALTTALAFGLLILSATPVISAFGMTLLPGLVAAYLLALFSAKPDEATVGYSQQ